ncbi:Coenzyme F420:L-glutamate ligase [Geodia barretti]|uniref:Coenzyme F420:L-glutamate ligase n=1 Tax=Geodia barretti TaxID=519541 RepID=A0AA35TNI4_GEOBA|nr:Coenzyme F420:L-glutamate ligase [Geodia barretti]
MLNEVRIIGVGGMPEFGPGDDLAGLMIDAAAAQGTPIEAGDILVVTQKVISKVEGKVMTFEGVEPSALAITITEGHRRDPRHTEMILRESVRIVRMDRGVIIAETKHGFYCANAGIDASNIPGNNTIALLPDDSDVSAQSIREAVRQRLGVDVAVIVSDTFGRPWRNGAANVAIGVAGMDPLLDYVGALDAHGNVLHTTQIAVADELAAAAELVTGKALGIPVTIIRDYEFETLEGATIQRLLRTGERDLFR